MNKKDRWRFAILVVLVMGCFSVLVVRLANLQVRGGDDYGEIASRNMTKTIYERGSRGEILDVNGSRLAYDKKIYNVEFYRTPSSGKEQNAAYSKAIWEVIQTVEAVGVEVDFDFWLQPNEDGTWRFDTGTTDESVAARREEMFRGNFYCTSRDVNEIYDWLCENYQINAIDADWPEEEKLTLEDKLQVLGVWQEMQMNAFNSEPIVIAKDIPSGTMIELETRMISLDGMSISVENQRVYPRGTLACHILGYTGLIQSEMQMQDYLAKGYMRSDTVGLDGVENTMEEWLTPNSSLRQGYSVVEVDRSGRRIRELERVEPSDGNTVRLTIQSDLQAVTEQALEDVINYIRDEEEKRLQNSTWLEQNREELLEYQASEREINLAQNGAIVVLDMECRLLAMASYPDYDPNLFILGMDEAQYQRTMLDERNPLFNNAIQAADTPGSVFKMCTALAALSNGYLTLTEEIDDEGSFTLYDTSSTAPKCWTNYPSRHQNQTIVQGLQNSCNYFFYTIASRMGADGELLHEFASQLGLTSKTNIDLPGEAQSIVGCQNSLYDPSQPISGTSQDTWIPYLVQQSLKEHLRNIGVEYNINYSDERLDQCIKALMDMAYNTEQGADMQTWIRAARIILMEELGMTTEMVYRAPIMSPITEYLNEIKWGGSQTIMTAIGQSITMTTPIAMARYMAAIANGGYVYDVQIIDSIIAPGGEVINEFEPTLINDLSDEIGEYLPSIKLGLEGVVDDGGTAESYFSNWKYRNEIAAKTGTAEKSELDVESNSWMVAMAPYDDPEIVVVVYVPNGLSGAMSSYAIQDVVEYYLDSKVEDTELILPAPNAFAQ